MDEDLSGQTKRENRSQLVVVIFFLFRGKCVKERRRRDVPFRAGRRLFLLSIVDE